MPGDILEITKQTLGGIAPYLCFGVAQHEAWLKAVLAGARPDLDRCIRAATRHVQNSDSTDEAAAVVHAGMLFVAALRAGIDPTDAGRLVEDAIRPMLPEMTPEPDLGY